MNRLHQITLALLGLLLPLCHVARSETPNIVIIFADDLGYGDISCNGATKINTPRIDQLAAEGIRFTDAHAAASICSPSRYGILTGHSPWRLGKKGNGYSLPPDRLNLASMLRTQNYRAATIGKWHLGYDKDFNKTPIKGPLDRGFTYHFSVPSNHNDSTRAFLENGELVGRKEGEAYKIVKGQKIPDGLAEPRVEDLVDTTLTQKAIEFIDRNADKPFLLYFTPCCPHTHVTPHADFRGTSDAGLLGDYVQELDSHVGKILDTLDKHGLSENTIVIFTSDNGGSPKDFTGTHHVKLNLASTDGDILNKYKTAKIDARKMGHLTNGQYKDGKGHPWEGGHRIPMIVRWPGKVQPNTTTDYLLNLTDIFATAAEVIGFELPDDAAEDSFSFLPILMGQKADHQREAIFIQGDSKDNAIAVCTGRWKLIEWKRGNEKDKKPDQTHALFDLEADPGETNDVSESYPERVQLLTDALAEARENGRTRP